MIVGWLLGLETSFYKSAVYNVLTLSALVIFGCFLSLLYVVIPLFLDKLSNENK